MRPPGRCGPRHAGCRSTPAAGAGKGRRGAPTAATSPLGAHGAAEKEDVIGNHQDKKLPVHFFTIVLNGEPFIRRHIEEFPKLPFPWHWHVVEGVAELAHDTAWSLQHGGRVTGQLHRAGLSNDGTTEYLDELRARFPERVSVYRKKDGAFWDGKLEMVSAPLSAIGEECLLWQVDADELWSADRIAAARTAFLENPEKSAAFYYCNFYVGPELVVSTRDTYGNQTGFEWLRTWRYLPGDRWASHEPPRLCRQQPGGEWLDLAAVNPFRHAETEALGLVFEHLAYVTEAQLRFKEIYYGYADAVAGWRRLQEVRTFPVRLADYFPWVHDGALVRRKDDPARDAVAPPPGIGRILFVRADSIGDNVLAASMIPHIKARFPSAGITVLCQSHIAELYEACPLVDAVIGFDRGKAIFDAGYRELVVRRIAALHADLALYPLYSRDALYDFFTIGSGAPERIAMLGNLCNIPTEIRDENNRYFTRLVASEGDWKPELERNRDFLSALGIAAPPLQPTVWLTEDDRLFAERFFAENGLDPKRCVALFAGAQSSNRTYGHFGKALAPVCREQGLAVIAVGSAAEYDLGQTNLDESGAAGINMCGKLTLRRLAAVIERCRLAVGAETGTAHIACAVGTPNVVLLGGGHFGRFMPYTPLTTVACLPLACYRCDWRCPYAKTHCVKDLNPVVLTAAIRSSLTGKADAIRIFCQDRSMWFPLPGEPAWQGCEGLVENYPVEIVAVAEGPAPVAGDRAAASAPEAPEVSKAPAYRRGSAISEGKSRLTVVVPSYNYARYLPDCLDSILSQDYPNLELIVLDGGSTDGTVDVIEKYQRHLSFWRSRPDDGNYAAIEEGLNRATGEIMTWLNADDMFHHGAFDLVARIFTANAEVEWLTGRPNSFDEGGRQKHLLSFLPMSSRAKYLEDRELIQQEGTFWRRALWQRSGAFIDRTLPLAADLELWARFFRSARLFTVDTLIAGFRDHPLQKSKDKAGYTAEANRVLARERELFAAEARPFNPPAPLPILVRDDEIIF